MSQNSSEIILENAICLFDKPVYEIKIDFKLYKGEKGKEVYESYEGLIVKDHQRAYQKIGPMESIKGDSFYVKLNRNDKEILILEDIKHSVEEFFFDIKKIEKYYLVKGIKEHFNHYEMIFTLKPTASLSVYKVLLEIDKKTSFIKKQKLYFSSQADFSYYNKDSSKKDFNPVRLEIKYLNIKDHIQKEYFQKARYYSISEGDLQLAKEFADFELIPVN